MVTRMSQWEAPANQLQLRTINARPARPTKVQPAVCQSIGSFLKLSSQNQMASTPMTTARILEEMSASPIILPAMAIKAVRLELDQASTAHMAIPINPIKNGSRICELPYSKPSGYKTKIQAARLATLLPQRSRIPRQKNGNPSDMIKAPRIRIK